MAVAKKVRRLLRDKKGDEAVSFLLTTAMLVFIFATLVAALIYVMQYYNASYICRRVVRNIETTGQYDEAETKNILSKISNPGLEDMNLLVDTVYFTDNKIQLRQTFSLVLSAHYKITLLQLGTVPIQISLPIKVKVAGMSEVYWKP
ncbi:MAG: DUF4320 family protein [Oscillospiraceae bacterium]